MPDFTKRVQKQLALPEGEAVQQAAVVQPPGSLSRGVSTKFTLPGAIVSSLAAKQKGTSNPDEETISGRVPRKNGYFVVTNKRFLWTGVSSMGSVREIATEFAFHEVSSVELTSGGGMGNKLLNITFSDESAVGCAVAKSQKPDRLAAAIAAALN